MTKEKWEEMKKGDTLPIEALYEYWIENKKPEWEELSFERFAGMFEAFISQFEHRPIITPSGAKVVRMENVHKKVLDYFNTKFSY